MKHLQGSYEGAPRWLLNPLSGLKFHCSRKLQLKNKLVLENVNLHNTMDQEEEANSRTEVEKYLT